jgi:ABC-type branched-subunit amino acid transport system substrate-binding protein
MALFVGACGGDDEDTDAPEPTSVVTDVVATTAAPASPATTVEDAPTTEPETQSTEPASPTTEAAAATTEPADGSSVDLPSLPPPTGEEIVIGMVNSEGTPGLDFAEMRINVEAAAGYLNQHGGMGGRPIRLETCIVKGSPETSQACAQELAGKNVEMVLIGLDIFPDYPTYTAADIPVIGVLPITPGDYTADALFTTGGNATTMAAIAAAAKDHFGATSVGIVSADNAGANLSEASLTASLDIAGISHTTVKGGDNETDAGYQGLMREAAQGDPDLLISLYSDDGCIGTMRGRAALGIDIPAISTAICSGKTVLDEVGDEAVGWSFVGAQTQQDTPELAIIQEMIAPTLGIEPEEVETSALGVGALSLIGFMSIATWAGMIEANGDEVTGASIYEFLATESGLTTWSSGSPIECGVAEKYPSICSFTFPIAEYQEGGAVVTIEGLEAVSAKEFLP